MNLDNRMLRVKDAKLERALAGEEFLVFDGAMGTMIQKAGLDGLATPPDLLNLTHAADIEAIHRAYVEAGSDVVVTNTFSSNHLKLGDAATAADMYAAAARIARAAGARYVGGDIGPTGSLLEPLGTLAFDDAYDLFAEQARAAEAAGCDLIVIETMADLREAKAAVLAAVENTSLPVFATMTFGEDGRTFLGTSPAIAASTLSAMGVSAVGVNCSLGPDALVPVVREIARYARCPIMVQPNAGLPRLVGGETVYDVTPAEFAAAMEPIVEAGAAVVGGCCGTNPDFIRALAALVAGRRPAKPAREEAFVVTSAQEMVALPQGAPRIAVIGERINPTGKKRLKAALRERDYDYVVGEAIDQQEAGADILDVNAGLPDIDEVEVLRETVEALQEMVTAPLQIDSSDPAAIEAAVRGYAGRPLINSVNGKRASLDAVLPIAKHYGCTLVGLTLDEDGIPPTAEGRLHIAERIVAEAERWGIPRCDIAIDCLVMAAATNQAEVLEILRAVSLVKERLGVRTVLGVSNVSFGMPQRNLINATFLAAAFGAGLDMPILNPLSARYRDTVAAFRVLNGQDAAATGFIADYADAADPYVAGAGAGAGAAGATVVASAQDAAAQGAAGGVGAGACPIAVAPELADAVELVTEACTYVLTGRGALMPDVTRRLLEQHGPLDVVNGVFVPVLDLVGQNYDAGTFFLPQLMSSAEAVKAGFDVVKERVEGERAQDGAAAADAGAGARRTVLVATVEGDIHDIGKNIVKMLLENYGFDVLDLGRDVPPAAVVNAAREHGVRLVGLSALMTTTVSAMERTIALLRRELPDVAVMVGGAVLTADYAAQIGADFYAKDAAASARIATDYFAEI